MPDPKANPNKIDVYETISEATDRPLAPAMEKVEDQAAAVEAETLAFPEEILAALPGPGAISNAIQDGIAAAVAGEPVAADSGDEVAAAASAQAEPQLLREYSDPCPWDPAAQGTCFRPDCMVHGATLARDEVAAQRKLAAVTKRVEGEVRASTIEEFRIADARDVESVRSHVVGIQTDLVNLHGQLATLSGRLVSLECGPLVPVSKLDMANVVRALDALEQRITEVEKKLTHHGLTGPR